MLPSQRNTTMRFLRDFLSGDKLLLKMANVKSFNVPMYPELSTISLLKLIEGDEHILRHINYYSDDQTRKPEWRFLVNVHGTLAPEYLASIITE